MRWIVALMYFVIMCIIAVIVIKAGVSLQKQVKKASNEYAKYLIEQGL